MQLNKRRALPAIVFLLLFLGGISGAYFYLTKESRPQAKNEETPPAKAGHDTGMTFPVKVYYPSEGALIMEERMVQNQTSAAAIAEKAIEEFLKGPSRGEKTSIPAGTRLLGVYQGNDSILYVDLSDEFRRNFHGDAMSELTLLKGLYETIVSNAGGITDVKLIIEGKEIESIGGHVSILYPLKNISFVAGSG